jgi:hypothetical protein
MNRKERRAAKARKSMPAIVEIRVGRCRVNQELKTRLECCACGNDAAPWPWPDDPRAMGYGVARVECHCGKCKGPFDFPVCERCANSEDISDVLARKFFGAPNLQIEKGGLYESVESLKRDRGMPLPPDLITN